MIDGPTPWRRVRRKAIGDFRIFDLVEEEYERPDGRPNHSFYVLLTPDWVNVVPITPEGRVVLIRQFRAGSAQVTIEVPGGMVDARDRDPAGAAARELEEETGYKARRILPTGRVRPNPAFIRNWCHMFLALHAEPTGRIDQDPGEDVHAFEATWEDVDRMVARGEIDHSLVLNTLESARRVLRDQRDLPLRRRTSERTGGLK